MTVAHIVPRTDVDLPLTRPQSPAERAKACTCGHVQGTHEHYRRGTDCAVCDCMKYVRQGKRGLFRR